MKCDCVPRASKVEVNCWDMNCSPRSATRSEGILNLKTQWWMNALVTVSALMLLMGTASNHLEKLSNIVSIYCFPVLVVGNRPTMSI